jgi:hypothetical protein
MSKGIFMQGAVVLFRRPVAIAEVRALVERDHAVVKETRPNARWQLSGPGLVVRYREEVNGYAAVDAVDQAWPDAMGDPKADPFTFAAWTMGHFGPLAYPHGLRRAFEQAWSWPEARGAPPPHAAFVRILLSYVFGARRDAPVAPPDCDPAHELAFVTGIARAVLEHPDALCAFNPGGELVLPRAELDARLDTARRIDVPALDAWTNVRLFKHEDGWLVMDTVGNGQLDLPDQEAAFPKGSFEPSDVDGFLRNATLYLLREGPVVKDGDTMDGPGGVRWQAWSFPDGVSPPPRAVMRWLPFRPEPEAAERPVPPALFRPE